MIDHVPALAVFYLGSAGDWADLHHKLQYAVGRVSINEIGGDTTGF